MKISTSLDVGRRVMTYGLQVRSDGMPPVGQAASRLAV